MIDERPVHVQLAARAELAPDAVAVEMDGESLTYRELRSRAESLTRHLRKLGVEGGSRVGLLLERSLDLPVAILGTWNAGGAYVPLDPHLPQARLDFQIDDAIRGQEAPVIVARQPRSIEGVHVLPLDKVRTEAPAPELPEEERASPSLSDLAYLIYTSGTTGPPKAVQVDHGNLAHTMRAARLAFGFAPSDRMPCLAAFTFDIFLFELLGPLLAGGTSVLFPLRPTLDIQSVVDRLDGMTLLHAVPALMREIVDAAARKGVGSTLRRLFVGGDAVPAHLLADLRATFPQATSTVLYGPTEAAIICSCHDVRGGEGRALLGRPLPGCVLELRDPDGQPVAAGEQGEVWIGGPGVTRGYLNRPDLTAQRFVGGWYRSGDLARLPPDGALEFLGRMDDQVKLRGFRIELGEIEAVLAQEPAVRQATVLAMGEGERKHLAAFVVASGGWRREDVLRQRLAAWLPEYMVPSSITFLEAMPLTPHGKVDRRALAAFEPAANPSVLPRTSMESAVAQIWAEVLGVPSVGATDDFFALGGHSLLAFRAASRVRDAFGNDPGMRGIFDHPTVASFAEWLETQGGAAETAPRLAALGLSGPAPLSSAQQRLWFLERLRPGTAVYNLAQRFDLRGDLSIPRLAAALEGVVRRHDALRTRFVPAPDGATQVISPATPVSLPVIDLEGLPEPALEAGWIAADVAIAAIAADVARRPYDLERGPLLRAVLLRRGPAEHQLLLGMHHIVSDAWSFGVLMRELSALYSGESLPPLPVQVPDFAVWQRGWLASDLAANQAAWWRERLAGAPTVLDLPTDRLRPAGLSQRGERLRLALGEEAELAAFSRRHGATLFMTLLAAFEALLYRWTGQEDMIVGSPVAGRDRLELEGLIGFFVNLLPLRAELSAEAGFARLVGQAREMVLGAFTHQELPFDHLVEALSPERDPSRAPLVQAVLALQDAPYRPDLGVEVTAAAEVDTGTSRFDLALFVERGPGGLEAIGEYASELFDRDTLERMLGAFRALLGYAAADPEAPIGELSLLAPEEWAQVLRSDDPALSEVPERPVHHLFEDCAALTPDALAVSSLGRAATYGELERRANRLAHQLRRMGVEPEGLVALLLERSEEMVVSSLAALKAGGAFLPIDPAYPAERALFILRDAGPRVLVSTERILAGLPEIPLDADRIVLLDRFPDLETAPGESEEPPQARVEPEGLAYVIYTSGSTGMPKGTELRHRGLSNLAAWQRAFYGIGPADRLPLVAAPGFDAAVLEMWAPLTCGASLHVAPREVVLSPASFVSWAAEHRLTLAFLPTPLAESVLAEPDCARMTIRALLTGGDRLRRRPAADLPFALSNLYGPTESTVVATAGWVEPGGHRSPHIGRAVANIRASVLDRGLGPVSAGMPGELCLAGEGLARGYRGRPDLTAERFVPDPHGAPGARLYRTGDLARRLPSGDLEFLGRIDHQVKIRGYRIELGEVEAALSRHSAVKDAAVLAREGRLVAYLALREGVEPDVDGLRAFLAVSLPEAMIPSGWAFVRALPVTANGKVDRRALERIEPAAAARAASVPPRTPMEAAVAEAWSSLLGVEGIGALDDFFALGGHSLLAARLTAAVQERLGVELPLRVVFERPTVAGLAAWIEAESGAPDGPRPGAGPVAPLSFAQQRLWFLDRLQPGSATYNIAVLLNFSGPLRPDVLELALTEVVRRHAALRTTFETPEVDADPVQVVHPASRRSLPVVDLSGLASTDGGDGEREGARLAADEARRPFDLGRGPLLRGLLLRFGPDEHRLLVTVHHIVSDGWSVGVLQHELGVLYRAFVAGRPSPLPELPIQYSDFAAWQRTWLAGAELERQSTWWRGALAGAPVVELATDRPRPAVWSDRGAVEQAELPESIALKLERLGQIHGATSFMTFFAAFLVLLRRYTGQEDLVVGAPVAGRDRPEVAGLIGFFVNTLALRVSLAGNPSFEELLARVRETALAAYAHQDLPFEKLVAGLLPGRDLSRNPLFQVVLAAQDLPSEEIVAEGLTVRPASIPSATAKFDLTLGVRAGGGRTTFEAEYSADLFESVTLRRLLGHFVRVLEVVAELPERSISDLPLLTAAEEQQIRERNDRAAAAHGRTAPRAVENAPGVGPRTPLESAVAEVWASLLDLGGTREVGAFDDFFALGGHSLLATRLAGLIRGRFGVELPLRVIFQEPTVERLAAWIEAERNRGAAAGPGLLTGTPAVAAAPLSFAQQRLWFLDRLEPGSVAYNLPILLAFSGPLRPEILRLSLAEVARRHAALRTTFELPEGAVDPVQVVHPVTDSSLPMVDLSGLPSGDRESECARRIGEEAYRPFDLRRGPLLRSLLLRMGTDEHRLLVMMHHIISDGWSVEVLQRELGVLYQAFAAGELSPLPELPLQYPDFAVWQRSWMAGAELERQLSWWRGRLAAAPVVELPADRPRPKVRSDRGAVEQLELPERLASSLERLGQIRGATPFMTFLATFLVLLRRYTGQEDLVVGTPVAGRDRSDLAGLIGFFVNTLALRVSLAGDPSFEELLARVRVAALGAYAHQDLPFEKLVAELVPNRDLSRNPLFQLMLAFQNVPAEAAVAGGLTVRQSLLRGVTAKFDLTLGVSVQDRRTIFDAEYSTELFEAASIVRLLRHLVRLLEGITEAPERRISELPLLTAAEEQQLLEWNDTSAGYSDVCLHELVEAQVERTPERPAVSCEDRILTYRELDGAANRLARRLRAAGAGPDGVVGVLAERSLDMAVGLLAVLKAGAAYLPLDPDYPAERLAFMVADSRLPVVLAQERLLASLAESQVRILPLDGAAEAGFGEAWPEVGASPESLAYVIYTSGSTGRPKGTMVPHRAIVNHLQWMQAALPLGASDRVLQKTSLSFDASVWEVWAPLTAGALLVLARPGEQRAPDALVRRVREEGATVLQVVPSLLGAMLESGLEECRTLRRVCCGGEPLTAALAEDFFRAFPRQDTELLNFYGPTETAVEVVTWVCERNGRRGLVPIGLPVSNTWIHLVDDGLRAVPAGVHGELLVGGAQVGRGYLGRPELTAERFVPDPFSGEPGARLYRTGDLARRLPDGVLDYLGRIDQQVKLRGLRIELGEVEAALCRHPGVSRAAVVVRGDRMGAWYVPAGEPVSPAELTTALRLGLPEYMVPAWFEPLSVLPLTPNGKVDRRALEAMAPAEAADASRLAPRTLMEAAVAEVWSGLLGVEEVGAFDDFFALGGHSLMAARVAARLRERLGVELPLRVIFQEPTVARLAAWIEAELRAGAGGAPVLAPRLGNAASPLSFAQQRLWFLDRLQPGSYAYNLPFDLRLSGPLRPAVLERALAEVVLRHAALRTTFEVPAGVLDPVQVVHPAAGWSLPVVDLDALAPATLESEAARLAWEEACRPFNLGRRPLMRTLLLRTAPGEHRLLGTLHHIVSDGVSMDVLQRELAALIPAFAAGRPSPLPELPVQYPDFAVWQRTWLSGGELERQLAWWREWLGASTTVLELPTDRPRPAVWSQRGGVETLSLPAGLGDLVERLGRRHGATPFMTLLGAFLTLLHRYTNQDELLVGAPVAGRDRPEVAGLIGLFVNTLALRVSLADDPPFRELLARVRESALQSYAYQDLPFEMLVSELVPERDLSRNPLVQVIFALQDAPEPVDAGDGLVLLAWEGAHTGTAKFDLSLHIGRAGGGMKVGVEYGSDLFDPSTIQRLLGHFRRLLDGIADIAEGERDRRLSELPLLDAVERDQVLTAWNRTAAFIPEEPVHELFFQWAERTPDATALAWDGGSMTYGELARRSRLMAARLRSWGVGPESVVALRLDRSAELLTAALAVLRAGGAYLPIDPANPEERADWILRDSEAELVLTAETVALLASVSPGALDDGSGPETSPDSLAYVIYTSGSTGRPKGTELCHRGLSSLIAWHRRTYGLGPGDRTTLLASPGFDASVWETWAPLTAGAELHIPPRGVVLSPPALLSWMADKGITVSFLPTPLAEAVLAEPQTPGLRLRSLLTGGDRLRRRPAGDLPFTLVNHYGPTESTVVATAGRVEPAGERAPDIGEPIANTRVYIVDRWLQPVPAGVPGELCLAGEGLARGYRHRPELTAGSFVPDPFGDGARLYRTGDLARRLASGSIEFLGRIDHQVKVRGNRIELGEVEAALTLLSGVEACVAMARPDSQGENRLVAYVVPKPGLAPEASGLRSLLETRLPASMIPSVFVVLAALPLDAHGKIDRRALPEPELPERVDFTPPRTPLEEDVARIWREVLGVERIGIGDSFWDLGGHSLLATRVLTRVEAAFGVELPLQHLFTTPTLAGFTSMLAQKVFSNQEGQEMEEALAELDGMSEDEVRVLIEQTVRELEELA